MSTRSALKEIMTLNKFNLVYVRLLETLAAIGAICIVFVLVVVVYDVTSRTLGFGSVIWSGPLTEYALLYTVASASPWLVHKKGHIMIESVVDLFPVTARHLVGQAACSLCLALCLLLLYYFTISGWESYRWNEADIRAITLPRWAMYFPFPIMFLLSAIEFSRFLFGSTQFLSGHGSKTDGI
jgi:TRAP-type C4-dicarboxylate transport system permease small subunit